MAADSGDSVQQVCLSFYGPSAASKGFHETRAPKKLKYQAASPHKLKAGHRAGINAAVGELRFLLNYVNCTLWQFHDTGSHSGTQSANISKAFRPFAWLLVQNPVRSPAQFAPRFYIFVRLSSASFPALIVFVHVQRT
jgi:hypothetical protein